MTSLPKKEKFVYWFKEIDKHDLAIAGGKGANLGELTKAGFPVPPGFVVSSSAYFHFLEANQLKSKIHQELKQIDKNDPHSYSVVSQRIKAHILKARLPETVSSQIMDAYLKMGGIFNRALVAVRSSATAEDLPTASFAGQQATYLNIQGESNLINSVHQCWASLFEPRAIFYRQENKFDHFRVGIAVPVQQMVPSDISGVMFTQDPVSQQKNVIVVEAVWGLGEYIVQGTVTPDSYLIKKDSLDILKKDVATQKIQLCKVGRQTKSVKVPARLVNRRKLSDKQIIEVAKMGRKIHQHYFFPQDIEWAYAKNKLYLLQSRPITTLSKDNKTALAPSDPKGKPLLVGAAASPGIASGPVKKIFSVRDIGKVDKNDILVTPMTSPDFVPAMKKVSAIITDKGGQTSHAAIVSRELGIPCVVGTKNASVKLKSGQSVIVNGSTGRVFAGTLALPSSSATVAHALAPVLSPKTALKTATKLYLNLAEPQLAKEMSARNVDGVGLLRAEFMIADLGVHPKKLIHDKKQKLLVNKLAEGMEQFCEAFYPRPIVYRATDFKTNEYRHLTGGAAFEPVEPNPFIGFRGTYRYISNPEVFELELDAIRKVRQKYHNLWLMMPFVHSPQELRDVKKIIYANGLSRSSTFKLWLMVEIPANVILLQEFINVGIDGVSIGSNDLTMLILGVDRDNQELASAFDERNPAVLWAIERTVRTCAENKVTSSICGQAASSWSDLVENMVKWGITSVSVNPDVIDTARETIYNAELKLLQSRRRKS